MPPQGILLVKTIQCLLLYLVLNKKDSMSYRGKCDKCGQEGPEFFVQVNKTSAGDSGSETQFWCLECVRGKSFEGSE